MLDIHHLHKHFSGVHALKDVSLNIESGTVLALVGDNGAGKSTLMKCISGVFNADSGSIHFDGLDITHGTPAFCRQAGIEMIYQDLALCKLQDVIANVFLGQEERKGLFLNKDAMNKKCAKTFDALGIGVPLNAPVGRLSGGQQQSIAIARAMLSKPKLLIMDEPTAALAIKESKRVIEHIRRLRENQVAVIMITHKLDDVFEVADRIIVMRQGEIRHDLSPTETDLKDLTCKIIGG